MCAAREQEHSLGGVHQEDRGPLAERAAAGPERGPRASPRRPQEAHEQAGDAVRDDHRKLGTLFGELNRTLLGMGFARVRLGEQTVEPVVVLVFWALLWFLGLQAFGLVAVLCLVIVHLQQ